MIDCSYRGAEWWKYKGFNIPVLAASPTKAGITIAELSLAPGEWIATFKGCILIEGSTPVAPVSLEIGGSNYDPIAFTENVDFDNATNIFTASAEYCFSFHFNQETMIRVKTALQLQSITNDGLLYGFLQCEGISRETSETKSTACSCKGK